MKNQNSVRWVIVAVIVVIVLLFVGTLLFNQFLPMREHYIHLPTHMEVSSASGSAEYSDGTAQSLQAVQIDTENVAAVVRTLSRPDAYTLSAVTEVSASGRTLTTEITHSVRENLSATVRTIGEDSTHIVRADGTEYVWTDGGTVWQFADLGEDAAAGLAAYEVLYETDTADITDAGYAEWEGFSCICFTIRDTASSLSSRYYVDMDTGLLIHAETWNAQGEILYRMQTTSIVRDTPEDTVFYLPDGTMPGAAA